MSLRSLVASGWHARTRALVLAIMLVVAVILPAATRADETGDTFKARSLGHVGAMVITRLGYMTVSDPVVHVGESFTLTAVLTNPQAWGTLGYEFPELYFAEKISSCENGHTPSETSGIVGDRSCTYVALEPTYHWAPLDTDPELQEEDDRRIFGCGEGTEGGWEVFSTDFQNGQGTGCSDTFMAVLPNEYDLEGFLYSTRDKNGQPIGSGLDLALSTRAPGLPGREYVRLDRENAGF